MKKQYQKPMLYVEEFQINENIAGIGSDCSIPNHNHWSTCKYADGDYTFFYVGSCKDDFFNFEIALKPDGSIGGSSTEGVEDEIFCTNGPTSGTVFNS